MARTWVALGLVLGMAGAASAQTEANKDGPRREGEYQGVKPGESDQKPKQTSTPRVTWVGFQPKADGSSRFFVQLNQPVDAQQTLDDKNVLHVTLPGAVFTTRNSKRRLDTRFFDTPVAEVNGALVRRSRKTGQQAGVRYSFRFKSAEDAQQASLSVNREEDGYHYLYLDFGPAKSRPEDPSTPTGPDNEPDVAP